MASLTDLKYQYYSGNLGEEDQSEYSEVTNATEGQVILTTPELSPGLYEVTCYTSMSGGATGADRPNTRIRKGTTQVLRLINTIQGVTDIWKLRVKLESPQTINVQAISAATSTAIYRTSMQYRKLS
jgi:hypothetical protein